MERGQLLAGLVASMAPHLAQPLAGNSRWLAVKLAIGLPDDKLIIDDIKTNKKRPLGAYFLLAITQTI